MSENGNIQYKVGDRVRFRPEHVAYRDLLHCPNEFIINRVCATSIPQECCIVYGSRGEGRMSSFSSFGSRIELVEAATKPTIQEKPPTEIPVKRGETRWGLVDKTGKILHILRTRKDARDIKEFLSQHQYKVKKLIVSIA